MKKTLIISALILTIATIANSQACNPQGNQTSYGTNNVWIGYVYDNIDLTSYKGYVNEGSATSPNFDESFGGDDATYATNGCSVSTSTFSVRYKLKKTFTAGVYDIIVGGDDGYRLSVDGGSTWVINKWVDQGYASTALTISLSGSTNLVLEYYENGGANRISFSIAASCTGTENTATYGTSNKWKGYVYSGTNFATYRGMMTEGTTTNSDFDESFGGDYATFTTSGCTAVSAENFSVRYRLVKSFVNGQYTFFLGGDDGYRLSLDGGSTWVINKWNDQGYNVSSYTTVLNGSYNMVIEYYENSGGNRISFASQLTVVLPVKLISFTGTENNNKVSLNWKTAAGSNADHYEIERSADANAFNTIASINDNANANAQSDMTFTYTDALPLNGKSYYRLKMVDESGTVTYSSIISVHIENATAANAVVMYPTILTSNTVSLRSASSLKATVVTVVNANGAVISVRDLGKIQAGQAITFAPAASKLARGIYFVQVADNGQLVTTQKLIVQ